MADYNSVLVLRGLYTQDSNIADTAQRLKAQDKSAPPSQGQGLGRCRFESALTKTHESAFHSTDVGPAGRLS